MLPFDIRHIVVCHVQKKLFTIKNSPVFLAHPVYLDRFNTYRKVDSESYVAFASRLTGLLNYYLESRHVDDFDGLFELLICDRIKSSLSEACLRHVLSVENATERGWLDIDALSDAVDKYAACYNNNNRPQAFAIGQNVTRAGTMQYKPGPPQKFGLNAAPKSNNGGRFTPVNVSGTRKCYNCGASDHLRDRCPKLNRSTADITGRSARVSRVNAVDDRSAISQPNATRGACSQRATNNFHTSTTTRGVRGAGSRRVMSGRVFHASTAARDHTDTATCDSARVNQYTTPTATISNQSVQTDNSQIESNSAVSDCVHDVYCNKIKAAVDFNEFESEW